MVTPLRGAAGPAACSWAVLVAAAGVGHAVPTLRPVPSAPQQQPHARVQPPAGLRLPCSTGSWQLARGCGSAAPAAPPAAAPASCFCTAFRYLTEEPFRLPCTSSGRRLARGARSCPSCSSVPPQRSPVLQLPAAPMASCSPGESAWPGGSTAGGGRERAPRVHGAAGTAVQGLSSPSPLCRTPPAAHTPAVGWQCRAAPSQALFEQAQRAKQSKSPRVAARPSSAFAAQPLRGHLQEQWV